jgi:adenine-specific DNA-methyltransferase
MNDMKSQYKNLSSVITEANTSDGTKEVNNFLGSGVFSFPKPSKLLSIFVEQATSESDLVLDFFAGSGTLGHAVMLQNAIDGLNRRFILVQLPEPLDPTNRDQKTASDFCDTIHRPRNISELTKERLRRAGKKIKDENPMFSGDTGFRVFKLDKSNIREWNPATENIAESLLAHNEHILEGRTESDIVYELLLKLGLDLCVPIESRTVAGKTVEAVGAGVLMLCLSEKILTKEVEAIAIGIVTWHKELAPAGDSTVVFRDSAFADDVAKTNMAAILSQNGLENIRSL